MAQECDILIRRATRADADSLAEGNARLARETESKTLDPETVLRGVRAALDDPQLGFYMVAESEGRVVGQLMITYEWSDWRNGMFWWVQSVYVWPEVRRGGVFRALHAAMADEARRARGVCGLRLYVEKDNATAQQVYRALGLAPTAYHVYELPFPDPA